MTKHPLNTTLVEFDGEIARLLPALHALVGDRLRFPKVGDLWWETAEAAFDLDQIVKKINGLAPEGYVFGGHPLHPQCLGYWYVDQG